MINTKLFKRAFLILLVLGVLNLIGTVLYLFDTVWWYDIVLHLLAGVFISMAVFTVLHFFFPQTPKNKMILIAVLLTIIGGALWEYYEVYIGATSLSDGAAYVFDTTKDMIDDIIGGIIGSFYSISILKKNG